jgi:hypothetical protein
MVRISFKRRDELLEQNAKAYYLTDHYEPYPAILVRLPKISKTSLKGLLAESSKFLRDERA